MKFYSDCSSVQKYTDICIYAVVKNRVEMIPGTE